MSAGVGTSGMPMEVVREVREDPPEELEESNWPAKGGYAWVASDVRDQSSLFRWSRLLNSWLNCTPVISRGVSGDIVSLERVSAIDRVCHGQEVATEKFFYMYMCHFSQLHIRLPFDDFTMGVLRALNVAPTQLHPNSWAYLQAFRILYESLYLEPSPYAFLYFYDKIIIMQNVPYLAKLNQVNSIHVKTTYHLVPGHHQHKPSRQVAGRNRLPA